MLDAGVPNEYKVSSNFTASHVNMLYLHSLSSCALPHRISLPAGHSNTCSCESPAGKEDGTEA